MLSPTSRGLRLATESRASVEATQTWHRVAGLLRTRRKEGMQALIGGRGGDDYGVRIDGWMPDSLELFVLLWSASQALNELMGVCHKAWVCLNHEVNRGRIWYTSPMHDGVADVLGIDAEEAKRLYAAGVEYVHAEIVGHELGEEWWQVFQKEER